jgi:hypothetical protein
MTKGPQSRSMIFLTIVTISVLLAHAAVADAQVSFASPSDGQTVTSLPLTVTGTQSSGASTVSLEIVQDPASPPPGGTGGATTIMATQLTSWRSASRTSTSRSSSKPSPYLAKGPPLAAISGRGRGGGPGGVSDHGALSFGHPRGSSQSPGGRPHVGLRERVTRSHLVPGPRPARRPPLVRHAGCHRAAWSYLRRPGRSTGAWRFLQADGLGLALGLARDVYCDG